MAAATVDRDKSFESALECTLNDLELNFTLKNEQITALKSFILKRDVVGVLPTGYGKSVIYQLAPLVASVSVALTTSIPLSLIGSSDSLLRAGGI